MLDWFIHAPIADQVLTILGVWLLAMGVVSGLVDWWTRWQCRRAQARLEHDLEQGEW